MADILHRGVAGNKKRAPTIAELAAVLRLIGPMELHVVGRQLTVGAQYGKAFHLGLGNQ